MVAAFTGLVRGLAATWCTVRIHQMNRVNSRGVVSDYGHDDSAINTVMVLLLVLLLQYTCEWLLLLILHISSGDIYVLPVLRWLGDASASYLGIIFRSIIHRLVDVCVVPGERLSVMQARSGATVGRSLNDDSM